MTDDHRPVTTNARIRYLATFPHGLPLGEPYAMAKPPQQPPKPHVHVWAQVPAKDGRIYLVCACGASRVA